jgi:hypothetical protein
MLALTAARLSLLKAASSNSVIRSASGLAVGANAWKRALRTPDWIGHDDGIRSPKAVCPDLLIGFKSMPYVMRYNHFPH